MEKKYRSLGVAVLVYALVASGTLLPAFFGGWPESVNAALWLFHVLAGFGLIRGNEWGRVLILFITIGSLLAMLVLFALRAEAVYSSMSMVLFFGGVPTVVILVWALVIGSPAFKEVEVPPTTQDVEVPTPDKEVEVPPPTGHPRKPRISRRALHDIAYISFVILGLISFWTSYFVHSEIEAAGGKTGGVDGVLGFLVLIPFGIPLLLALVLGPAISLYLWRDYRLMTLTVLSIGLVMALITLGYKTWPMLLSSYGAICTAIGIIWFTKYRRTSNELPIGYK